MKRGSENIVVAVFGALFLLAIIMIFSQGIKTTGYATTGTTTSNVTIHTYYAIEMSTNLTDGIRFGNLTSLPIVNQNATHNIDGVNSTVGVPANYSSSMWINVSSDSNTAVDFCIYADQLNTSAGDYINLPNETYYNSTFTNISHPSNGSEVPLSTTATKAGPAIAVGSKVYYRFWLDVPVATVAGTYNNTVTFNGIQTGGGC